jgi:hypothetical protein
MKTELFQELLESVQQGAAILRGEAEPSRRFVFPGPAEDEKPSPLPKLPDAPTE